MNRKVIKFRRESKHFYYPARVIYPFLIFLKIIGLLTLSVRLHRNGKKSISFGFSRFGIAYNILLYVLYSVLHTLIIVNGISFNYPGKTSMIDNIVGYQIILSAIVVSAVLLTYCIKQKSMARIGNGLVEVHMKLDSIEFSLSRKALLRRSIAIGIVHFVISCLEIGLSSVCLHESDDWRSIYVRIYWAADIFVLLLLSFLVFQYFLIVTFIGDKFVEINSRIKCTSKSLEMIYANCKQRTSNNSAISCIMFVKDMYSRLIEISNTVNDCFSVAILFNTMYVFYNLTSGTFYVIVALVFNSGQNYINLSNMIISIIYPSFLITLLSFAITKLQKEAQETARIVHNLLSYTNDPELVSELSLFSLQLLHEKPHFTACGFFDLDCSLLQGIIGAVTTYMVILIQFHVSTSINLRKIGNNGTESD